MNTDCHHFIVYLKTQRQTRHSLHNMNKTIRILFVLSILLAQVGCDQISKKVVRQNIEDRQQISVVDNFITLTKVENPGAFLSLGNSLPKTVRIILFIAFPVLLLFAAFIYLFRSKGLSIYGQTGVAFLIGGGIGNLIDRILYGSVTDFVHLDFAIFQTGVFNMADVSIMAGMFILLGDKFFNPTVKQAA